MTVTVEALIERRRTEHRLPDPAVRRLIRESAGASQAEIAEILGVSREAVTRWENGDRTPRRAVLRGYLSILDQLRQAAP